MVFDEVLAVSKAGVLVGPPEDNDAEDLDGGLRAALKDHSVREAAALVTAATGLPKKVVYARALVLAREGSGGRPLNRDDLRAAIMEGARDGRSVADLMSYGATLLTREDVMEGIPELIPDVQVEATFPDGTKLVTVHLPIP